MLIVLKRRLKNYMAILKLCKEDYLSIYDIVNVIDYIMNKQDCILAGAKNIVYCPYDASYIADQMIVTKKIFNQINGRHFYHLVFSLQPYTVGAIYKETNSQEATIKPEELDHLLTVLFSGELLQEYQVIYGIHKQYKSNDTVNLHAHILLNSVSLEGTKIELRKKQLWEYLNYLGYWSMGLFKKQLMLYK